MSLFSLNLCCFQDSQTYFIVDASTNETISADLSQIAIAKGIGDSEKATLDWLSMQRKEWLILLDNATIRPSNLRGILSPLLTTVISDYEPKP